MSTDGSTASVIYTQEVPDAPAKPGEGKPRVSAFLPGGKTVELPEGVTSIYENFLHGVSIAGDHPFLGTRTVSGDTAGGYTWQTYNEIHQRVKNLGCGLVAKGVTPIDNVGLFAINRAEWVIAEQACFMFSLVTVPLYDTLGSEAIEYICTQTKLSLVFATKDKAAVMLKLKPKLPDLKTIIVLDSVDQAIIDSGRASGVEIVSIIDIENLGAKNPADPVPPSTETIATICYTSGTTGLPKGVMLTHGNMLAFTAGMNENYKLGRFSGVSGEDVYMSYLPLAHVFERACQITVINHGASIGFFQGSALKLLDDVAELKPTIFPSVPRVYNRIFDRVWASVKTKSAVSQFLFNTAFNAKKFHLQRGSLTHWLWDRLVFSSVRARLGGRCRMLLTGAAPISAEVIDFLRICFSCQVYEGYGQTETCASLSVSDMNDLSSGHVGVPNPCTQVKLIDVPSMNYTSADKPFPRGEICVKGACVFKGYYNSPEKTAETFDADGWLRTGDVGMWDSQGRLAIIDRVKNIFKLAQGEYIAPEKIENTYQKHELVAQAFVYGDSLQSTLVAVIIPDEETFIPWCAEKGFESKPFAELCKDKAICQAFVKALEEYGKKEGLKGFENVKAVHLDSVAFSVENDILTPTFKLKRHEAKKKYQAEIDALYAALA